MNRSNLVVTTKGKDYFGRVIHIRKSGRRTFFKEGKDFRSSEDYFFSFMLQKSYNNYFQGVYLSPDRILYPTDDKKLFWRRKPKREEKTSIQLLSLITDHEVGILAQVISYLDILDMMNMRLVNKFWNKYYEHQMLDCAVIAKMRLGVGRTLHLALNRAYSFGSDTVLSIDTIKFIMEKMVCGFLLLTPKTLKRKFMGFKYSKVFQRFQKAVKHIVYCYCFSTNGVKGINSLSPETDFGFTIDNIEYITRISNFHLAREDVQVMKSNTSWRFAEPFLYEESMEVCKRLSLYPLMMEFFNETDKMSAIMIRKSLCPSESST